MIPTNIHSPLNRLALDAFLNTAEGRAQTPALVLLAVQLGRARYDLAHTRPAPKKAEGMGRATRRTRIRTPARIPDATPEQNAAYIEELDRYVSRPTRDWEK